ncbi:putative Exo-beta-1,3-glucanase [Cryomyces antarcticus]
MFVRNVLSAALAVGSALAVPLEKRDTFTWGSTKIRGVNIGGWLVLEPWITPSIFQQYPLSEGIVDEYTLGQTLGHDAALSVLKPHWDSWATLADFQKIANAGFNLVRIPIGFWAYNTYGTPYVQGAAPYMDSAISWARQTGLKVMIDLHGAPGSQNGFDNSGQRKASPGWESGATIAQTLDVLSTIANKYAASAYSDVVVGIELLNEPLASALNVDEMKQFYRDGYGRVRQVGNQVTVVLQDAFLPPSTYNGFLSPSDNNAQLVALDHHEYQVFNNDQVAWQPWQHRQAVCNGVAGYTGSDRWEFVGEWTAAMTDCAAALNGYGIGARYDGTYPGSTYVGSCANINFIDTWSATLRSDTRAYIEAQLETFESKTLGWIFWNFKTEASAEWDLFRLLNNGIFPQPLSDRHFGAICSN